MNVYRIWDHHEAVRRFNAACRDIDLQRFEWKHLPVEAALLLPLERIPWLQVSDEASDEELNDAFTPDECDNYEASEEQASHEKKKRRGRVLHTSSRTRNSFLPKPYPFYLDDINKHPTLSELKEFLPVWCG